MLLNYQSFLFETYAKIKLSEARENFLKTIASLHLNEDENHCVNFIISECLTAEVFEIAYNDTFDEVLYENFIEKAKEKYEKAKEYLKAKGKDFLKTASDGTKALLKIGGNILSVLKMIVVKIGSAIKEGYKKVVAAYKAVTEKHQEEIEAKLAPILDSPDNRDKAIVELKNIKQMTTACDAYFLAGFPQEMNKAVINAAKEDEDDKKNESTFIGTFEAAALSQISSDIKKGISIDKICSLLEKESLLLTDEIDESDDKGKAVLQIPYISSIIKKISHWPGFKQFHTLGDKVGKYANNSLSKCSLYMSRITQQFEPVVYVVMGGVAGAVAGWVMENEVKKGIFYLIEELLGYLVWPLGWIKNCIGYAGIAIAVYGVFEAVLGKSKEDSKETHTEEKPKDNEKE